MVVTTHHRPSSLLHTEISLPLQLIGAMSIRSRYVESGVAVPTSRPFHPLTLATPDISLPPSHHLMLATRFGHSRHLINNMSHPFESGVVALYTYISCEVPRLLSSPASTDRRRILAIPHSLSSSYLAVHVYIDPPKHPQNDIVDFNHDFCATPTITTRKGTIAVEGSPVAAAKYSCKDCKAVG